MGRSTILACVARTTLVLVALGDQARFLGLICFIERSSLNLQFSHLRILQG